MSLEEAEVFANTPVNKGFIDYGEHKKQPQFKLT